MTEASAATIATPPRHHLSISVVVPAYNRADLIRETLTAILAQTQPADEIIVVDDGSTDGTGDVVADISARVRCIRIQNSGELVTRNVGLKASTSDLVAFCDSDDLWRPDFLLEMSNFWQDFPDLTAAYANFCIFQGGVVSERTKFDDAPAGYWNALRGAGQNRGIFEQPFVDRLLRFQPFFPSCMMVSRAAFLALGAWDEGVSRIIGCDLATTLRIANAPPVGVVHRPLVTIRKHPGNFSADTERMNLGDARVLEHVLATRPELSSLALDIRQSIGKRRSEALDSAFSRRDFVAVQNIYRLLPPHARSTKQIAKWMIANLPSSMAGSVASMVSK